MEPASTESLAPAQTANRQIARAAATVMGAFILSNLVGLLRTSVIANAFGTSAATDAYNAASRIPELLFSLVSGGALASAFIPTFTGFLTRDDRTEAWRLASAVINLVLGVSIVVSLLAAVFAKQIVDHGLYLLCLDCPATQTQLTVTLLQTMLPSVAIFAVSGLLMGILNANQVFLVPAIAPAMYSLGIILGTLLLGPTYGVQGAAIGTVIGASLHLLVQIPSLWKLKGRRFFLSLGLGNAAVREVIRLMLPRLFGVAVVQLNFLVSTIIALSLPAGSNTANTYAWQLMMMPELAIAQSIAIASLPTFSAQVARNRRDDMRASLAATLRSVLFLALPASLGLILLRQPLITLLLQRGQFDAHSTAMAAWALLWYGTGLVGFSVVEIVSRAFYALHDTRTPVIVLACAMTLNVVLSLAFSSLFAGHELMPNGGLALANSVSTALEMVALLVLMRRRLNGLEGRRVWAGLGQAVLATAVMGLAVFGWMAVMRDQRAVWVAVGGVVLGGGIYALVGMVMRVPELTGLVGAVRKRVGL